MILKPRVRKPRVLPGPSDGHGGVVVEAVTVQHVEHGVAADGEEGSAHALDVLRRGETMEVLTT